MLGLDLAESFYRQIGEPALSSRFPDQFDRIAVGLVGPGSECFGFDDELSQDHDWGPAFCMWLNRDDHNSIGRSLQAEYERLPQTIDGFGPRVTSPGEEGRIGVSRIVSFYQTYTGLDHIPKRNLEWLKIPESSLAVCTNGRVFHDPLGVFTRWREALKGFYPEDVRLKKIASRCISIAQYGQYNYDRSHKRGEQFAAQYALTKFCSDVLSLAFLLNRQYTPFYKWMHRAVKSLPRGGVKIHRMIELLAADTDHRGKCHVIEKLCAFLVELLKAQDLTDSQSDFLLDHAHRVHARIKDAQLGARMYVVN